MNNLVSCQIVFMSIAKTPCYHVTLVLHNSRVSRRMADLKIIKGDVLILSLEEECEWVRLCCRFIEEDKLCVYALNVCGDHLHMLIHCQKEELPLIVGRFKSKTARAFNIWLGLTDISTKEVGHDPLSNERYPLPKKGIVQNHFWARKFNRVLVDNDSQMKRVIAYIENNRIKHQLPEFSVEIQELIRSVIIEV